MDKREEELLVKLVLIGGFYFTTWTIVIFASGFSVFSSLFLDKKPVATLLLLLGLVLLLWFLNRLFFRTSCFQGREVKPDTAYNHGTWLFKKFSIAKKSVLVVSPRLDANIFDRQFCHLLDLVLTKNPKLVVEIVSGPVYQTINFKNYLINEATPLARKFGERFLLRFIDPAPPREFYMADGLHFLSAAGNEKIIFGDFAVFSSLFLEYRFRRTLRLQRFAVAVPYADEMCWTELRRSRA